MLNPSVPAEGLLFASFLYRGDLYAREKLQTFWEQKFGASFLLEPKVNPLENYYATEMGKPLKRFFVLSAKLFSREFLLSTKLQAIDWERGWSHQGLRQVNVDIGFLSAENFLLATTKNYAHRVYLGQGIFGDLTYQFSKGEFRTLEWTYPDYKDEEKLSFFTWCRAYLLQKSSDAKS